MSTPNFQEKVKGAQRDVDTLAPEPYRVSTPFTIVIAGEGNEFRANWVEANLHASAETQEQAFNNLKAIVLDTFDRLEQLADDELGPGLRKQKNTLSAHIAKLEV